MRMCDKKQKGHVCCFDMQAHLKNSKHKVFLNFMMRQNQKCYKQYDANHDELLDLSDMRHAVRGFFDSDMYGAEMKRQKAHPSDDRPAWKYNSPGAESNYNAQDDTDIYASHAKMNQEAHKKHHPKQTPRAGSPAKGDFRSRKALGGAGLVGGETTTLGEGHSMWLHAKQISFAVNRMAGVKGVGPPHFKEAHNVLSDTQVEQAKQVFRTWDKDHNGLIAPNELNMAIHAVISSMREITAQTAGHTSVMIGLDQTQVRDFVEEIFRQADWNHDGALDEEEFVMIYNTIAINCIDYNEITY